MFQAEKDVRKMKKSENCTKWFQNENSQPFGARNANGTELK